MPQILYRDNHLLVIEKPNNVLSQADATGGDSVPKRLELQGITVKPVHRLDRATGGVMVYALTDKSAASLSALVQDHARFCKEYLTVVCGCPSQPYGEMEDLLYHDVKRNKSFVVDRKRGGVKRAKLAYEVLQTVDTADGVFSLVRVRLHTGRTHQIRVQFASRKLPIAGDNRYGGIRTCPLALWSCRLTFPHPFSAKKIDCSSKPDVKTFPWNNFSSNLFEE